MKRSKHGWFVLLLLMAAATFSGAPLPTAHGQDKDSILKMDAQRDAMYKARLEEISKSNLPPDQKQAAYDKVYSEWLKGKQETAGLVGNIDRVSVEMDRSAAYRPPGFWDKVGDTALGIVGEMLKEAIKNWMNNPTEENRRRIEELEAERDRLMNERNNPNPGGDGGLGRPVYDDNGNVVGFDRDGDGRPDITDSNGDGTPDSFNPTNNDAYADPYEYLEGSGSGTPDDGPIASTAGTTGGAGDSAGGGITPGGAFNGSFGGGSGEEDPAAAGEGEGEGDKEGEEELAAAEGGEGTPTGDAPGSHPKTEKDKNGDGVDDAQQLTMHTARVMVLKKPDLNAMPGAAGAAGNRMPTGPVEDDWKDMDNGDAEDEWGEEWGNEWGEEPTTAEAPGTPEQPGALPGTTPGRMTPASEATKLVDQLIQVETVITEWRKQAKEEAEGKKDPYGFQDAKGYRGGGTTVRSQDPLAELRGPDGKLDLTRCDVWLVERDSWQEGKEPRRFQVTVGEDALDSFDPIHGGYVVVRGIVTDLPVDPRVIQEIRGEVKKLEVVQVILSQEEPPEALLPNGMAPATGERGSTTPSQPMPPLDEGDDSGW